MNFIRDFTRETRYFKSSFHASSNARSTSRYRREAAADANTKSFDAVLDHADERDSVDLRRVAAVRARRDLDLVLARQIRVLGIAVEELRRLVDDRQGIEQLVGAQAGNRAAGDVADGVAAPAGRGQPGGVKHVEHVRQRTQLEPVQLDVLA